jgi:hypothetical protein
MCFQYMILVYETYELWLNAFYTIFIIKSWDVKFVIIKYDQSFNSICKHKTRTKNHIT